MSDIFVRPDGKTSAIVSEESRKVFLYGVGVGLVGWYESTDAGTQFSDGGFLPKMNGEKYADWLNEDEDVADACAWLATTAEQLWGFHMILRHKKTYDALSKNYPTENAVEFCSAAQELQGFVHTLGESIEAAIRDAESKAENSKSEK